MTDSIWLRTSLLLTEIEDCIKDDLLHTELHDLSIKCVFTLYQLYRHDGQRLSDLAVSIGNMTTTFSWVVNNLVSHGLVERRDNLNDRRSPLIYLTVKGKRLRAVIVNAIGNAEIRYGDG